MKYNKFTISAVLLGLYFFPLLLLSAYGLEIAPGVKNWNVFSLGLFIALTGTGILFVLLSQWEIALKDRYKNLTTTPAAVLSSQEMAISNVSETKDQLFDVQEQLQKLETLEKEMQKEQQMLLEKISQKELELQSVYQDYEQYRTECEKTIQNLTSAKISSSEQLEQREEAMNNLQNIALQQKIAIENLQQQVLILQSKEEELNYEIKTLLHVSHMDNMEKDPSYQLYATSSIVGEEESPIEENQPQFDEDEEVVDEIREQNIEVFEEDNDNQDDPVSILRQCLDMAAKMNGVGSARNTSLPVENYVLDMRRLCDNLRIETGHGILLYSQKDSKLVFANSQVKDLLGWPAEKFIQIFPEIIQVGFTEWREGLYSLNKNGKAHLKVPMKSKEGRSVVMSCYLGAIENGIFRNHVIAILS